MGGHAGVGTTQGGHEREWTGAKGSTPAVAQLLPTVDAALRRPYNATGNQQRSGTEVSNLEATIDRKTVEQVLDRIRPALQMDGGDVELVDIEGKVVRLRMTGACGGCPMSQLTLQMGIEAALRDAIPDLERVEAVNLFEDLDDTFGE